MYFVVIERKKELKKKKRIERSVNISSYTTLENCLFGAVKLTKHTDVDLYKYSGYGIGFDRKGSY